MAAEGRRSERACPPPYWVSPGTLKVEKTGRGTSIWESEPIAICSNQALPGDVGPRRNPDSEGVLTGGTLPEPTGER